MDDAVGHLKISVHVSFCKNLFLHVEVTEKESKVTL